ncbi:hypothetical protein HDU76_012989 [Blyttiomyces sp. JEL0837]|nr:hypothetical protein HDU76_012989 [Blyttiomyces sp. JEL0837]
MANSNVTVTTDSNTDLKSVLISFGVQTAIAFGLIIAFSILRPSNKVVYQPRLKFAPEEKRPQPIGPAPTAWIAPVLKADSSRAVKLLGLDAVMFLKFVKFLFHLFLILSLMGIPMCIFNANFAAINGKAADTGVTSAPVISNQTNTGNTNTGDSPTSGTGSSSSVSLTGSDATTNTLSSTTSSQSVQTTSSSTTSSLLSSSNTSSSRTGAAGPTNAVVMATKFAIFTKLSNGDANGRLVGRREYDYDSGFYGIQRRADNNNLGQQVNNTVVAVIDSSLNTLTISQIDGSSPWYWLPASLNMLYRIWVDYIDLRKQWFKSEEFQTQFHNKTLLLTNVPDSLHNQEALTKFMQSLNLKYPAKQAVINRDASEVQKLVQAHEKATASMEAVLAVYLKDPNNVPSKRPTLQLPSGAKVDAIDHWGRELNRLEEKIYALRAKPDSDRTANSAGFVSFSTVKGAHSTAKTLRSNPTLMTTRGKLIAPPSVKVSPDFSQIIWDNIGITPAERYTRRLVALGFTLGLIVGWTFLVGGIGLLSDLKTLFKGNDAAVTWLNDHQQFVVFVQAFAAPVLLAIANILLPIVLSILTKIQGSSSIQGVNKSVLYKLFAFFVYQIFVVALISQIAAAFKATDNVGGSITDVYKRRITQAISGLANSSNLYLNTLSTFTAGYGIEIIQGVPLLMNFIRRRFFKLTPRQEFELHRAPAFNFTQLYGTLSIAFLISITFSVVSPLILPFSCLFFGLAFMVMKYQLMYVYEVRHETGGTWWPKVFNLLMIAIGFFQTLTLTVIFAANTPTSNGPRPQRQWVMVAPLPFLTGALWFVVFRFLAPRGAYVSKKDAAEADAGVYSPGGSEEDLGGRGGKDDRLALEDRVFNPALVKPLQKVWVWKRSAHLLPGLYTPAYESLEDYIHKHPEAAQTSPHHRRRWLQLRNQEKKTSTLPRSPKGRRAHGSVAQQGQAQQQQQQKFDVYHPADTSFNAPSPVPSTANLMGRDRLGVVNSEVGADFTSGHNLLHENDDDYGSSTLIPTLEEDVPPEEAGHETESDFDHSDGDVNVNVREQMIRGAPNVPSFAQQQLWQQQQQYQQQYQYQQQQQQQGYGNGRGRSQQPEEYEMRSRQYAS